MAVKYHKGQVLHKYFPWITGVQRCVVTERRTLVDGDYAINRYGVFKRVGSDTISRREREKEYWVVVIVPEGEHND